MTDNTNPVSAYNIIMAQSQRISQLEADLYAADLRTTHLEDALAAAHNVYPSIREAVAERDALAAVIEQISEQLSPEATFETAESNETALNAIRDITANADTDAALRERDAEKFDEGINAQREQAPAHEAELPVNPYREEQ